MDNRPSFKASLISFLETKRQSIRQAPCSVIDIGFERNRLRTCSSSCFLFFSSFWKIKAQETNAVATNARMNFVKVVLPLPPPFSRLLVFLSPFALFLNVFFLCGRPPRPPIPPPDLFLGRGMMQTTETTTGERVMWIWICLTFPQKTKCHRLGDTRNRRTSLWREADVYSNPLRRRQNILTATEAPMMILMES